MKLLTDVNSLHANRLIKRALKDKKNYKLRKYFYGYQILAGTLMLGIVTVLDKAFNLYPKTSWQFVLLYLFLQNVIIMCVIGRHSAYSFTESAYPHMNRLYFQDFKKLVESDMTLKVQNMDDGKMNDFKILTESVDENYAKFLTESDVIHKFYEPMFIDH